MQKYRADSSTVQPDGATIWKADWQFGPSLARINNCRAEKLSGEPRLTVYITGEPDTFFSIPAVCSFKSCRVKGYVTGDDSGNLVFRHGYY